jgi:PadR family transcriptional regulator, regulatory protein PadR
MPKKNKEGIIVLSALELDLLLALRGEELYGLKLLEQVNEARKQVGMSILGIGSLYPTLKRMEKAKLIKGEFREPVAGADSPRRKYYKLLGEGTTAISRTEAYRKLLERGELNLPGGQTQSQGGFSTN